jgi:hypothetical protein
MIVLTVSRIIFDSEIVFKYSIDKCIFLIGIHPYK